MRVRVFDEAGLLVSRDEWERSIDFLKKEIGGRASENAEKEISEAIIRAVRRCLPDEKFGVMLSGGVDSSTIALLCKKMEADFCCYSVGLEGAKDIEWAEKLAGKLNIGLKKKILSMDEVENIVKKMAGIIPNPDVVKIGVGTVAYAATELAIKDGARVLLSGLGSEEIFAGYDRHAKAEDINAECWKGLRAMWERDLTRDAAIAKALGAEYRAPFLDEELIRAAMRVPGNLKIVGGEKKHILRKQALGLGLPEEFASRKKIAAQYGSSIDKAIGKIAKKRGFSHKKDYVESLMQH